MEANNQTALYEFPLNNRIRLFLRYEYLAQSIERGLTTEENSAIIETLRLLHQLIEVNTRNDIRSEIMQHLNWQRNQLYLLQKKTNVNQSSLQKMLNKQEAVLSEIEHFQLSMPMYHNHHFLNAIQHRLNTPGGLAGFNVPMFATWLERSPQRKQSDLGDWYAPFKVLNKSINSILQLTRQSQEFKEYQAESGFYTKHFSAVNPAYQLIRIAVTQNIFPEISASKSDLTIYFSLLDDLSVRPKQVKTSVNFKLALCNI